MTFGTTLVLQGPIKHLRFSKQYPLVLLATVGWKQGRAFRNGEGRVKRNICVSNRRNKPGIWKHVLKGNFDKLESKY